MDFMTSLLQTQANAASDVYRLANGLTELDPNTAEAVVQRKALGASLLGLDRISATITRAQVRAAFGEDLEACGDCKGYGRKPWMRKVANGTCFTCAGTGLL